MQKKRVVTRQGRQNYYIFLDPEDLVRLEKQMLSIAKRQANDSSEFYDLSPQANDSSEFYDLSHRAPKIREFYNLPEGNSNYSKKSVLQICEPGALICFISAAIWLVHLVYEKTGQRVLLIVEGMAAEKHIVQCYEFVLSQNSSNPSSGFFLPVSGIGHVVKTLNVIDELEKNKENYQCRSWDVEPVEGQRLLQSLEAEVSFPQMQRNEYLAWAKAKLEAIGLSVKEGNWSDFTVVLSATVQEFEARPSTPIEENRRCLLM
jgi:hypothetical protein